MLCTMFNQSWYWDSVGFGDLLYYLQSSELTDFGPNKYENLVSISWRKVLSNEGIDSEYINIKNDIDTLYLCKSNASVQVLSSTTQGMDNFFLQKQDGGPVFPQFLSLVVCVMSLRSRLKQQWEKNLLPILCFY